MRGAYRFTLAVTHSFHARSDAIMKPRFRLPFNANRHGGFTTPLRLLLATTAAFWMGAAQPQEVATRVARHVTELRFRDFFRLPLEPVGLDISDTLRRADGQTIRLVGYMVQQESPEPGCFMLAPHPVQTSPHADGEADELPAATVMVYLNSEQCDWVVPHVPGLVSVSGRLGVRRPEEQDGRVLWVRLQLGLESVRGMSAKELTGYLHTRQYGH
jgi:hypothetical protein